MGVRTDEGEEVVIGPNQVFDLPPGHLTWVEGDEELVIVDWAGGAGFDVRPGESARVMATILFTGMVGSTEQAQKAGDAAWRHTVAMHDDVVRTVLVRFGGREVEIAGDSFLIVFDGAERAIRCGLALVDARRCPPQRPLEARFTRGGRCRSPPSAPRPVTNLNTAERSGR